MRPPRARFFNTTGPCDPQRHYMLPPTPRLPKARALIDMDRYFVVHAPRQTGKTTGLRTLASELTAEGDVVGDFTADQIAELYGQHTEATGQKFTKDAVGRAFELTQGQPWLVNALAHEITFEMGVIGDITAGQVDTAKERLIRARATHLDALMARLHEPRVKRVIEPIVAGSLPEVDLTFSDALSYVRDLGLIKERPPLEVANPIYREVILRVLGDPAEQYVMADPHSFVLPDGRFDLPRLLQEFVVFWREHGEVLIRQEGYHEAACQIILMAFLHRLVNGGGQLDREYAAGTKRLDVLIRWPYTGPEGERLMQREAMELKVWRAGRDDPLPDGLAQLDGYLDRLCLSTGVLVIFDRRPEAPPWKERGGFEQTTTPSGRQVTVLRA